MEKILVKDFKEGEHVNTNLLVSSLVKGVTNTGAPYLSLVLQDSSKTIDAKMWDVKSEVEKLLCSGKVFNFDLEINMYRNNLQAKVIKVLPVSQNDIDMLDFVSASPIPRDVLRENVGDAVNMI